MRKRVAGVIVSHRCDHRIAGSLHAETNYSKAIGSGAGKDGARHVRKPLGRLSAKDVENIVDPRIRDIVKASVNGGDAKRVFGDAAAHPFLETRDGRKVPIHRVRVKVNERPHRVGHGARERYVGSSTESNHHTVIVRRNGGNAETWEDVPVERLEVYRRLRSEEADRTTETGALMPR